MKTFVVCRLCHRKFKAITWCHLVFKHGEDGGNAVEQYRKAFDLRYVTSDTTRRTMKWNMIAYLERCGRRWTKARVVDTIRHRLRQGAPMNYGAVNKQNCSLVLAARRVFRQWDNALRAARINPERVRLSFVWTREKILEVLRRRHREGKAMNAGAFRQSSSGIYAAAYNFFGRWDNVLTALGLDPIAIRKHDQWSAEKAVEAIRQRIRQKKALHCNAVLSDQRGLYLAARKIFRGWDNALRAAGLNPKHIRRRLIWTRENVLAAILRRQRQKKSLKHSSVQRSDSRLRDAARARFGTWENALRVAGIDPDRIRKTKKWSPEKVIEAIRERQRRGESLEYREISNPLHCAAYTWFRGWRNALRAAGIDRNCIDIRSRSEGKTPSSQR